MPVAETNEALKATLPTYGIVEHDWGGLYKVLDAIKKERRQFLLHPQLDSEKVQMSPVRRSNVKLRLKRILVRYFNRQKLAPIFLVQQVPEPTVHGVLRVGTHLANLKRVRSIVFEELRNPDELERKRFLLAHKGGISEKQFHCRPQAWRIGKFRVNLVELPFVDRTGISNWHRYLTM